MPQGHIKLDNPVFAGTLRYTRRSVSYQSKPVHVRTVQDIAVVRRNASAPGAISPLPKPMVAAKNSSVSHKPVTKKVQPQLRPAATLARPNVAPMRPTSQPADVAPAKTAPTTASGKKNRRARLKVVPLYVAALVVFGFGLYVGITGLSANKKVTAQAEQLASNSNNEQAISGGSTPPSTDKPSDAALRRYAVAPANPRYIDIPSLKVHARVLAMTVDKHNQLQAPYGIYDAGWYTSSAQPGQAGATLIDGHSGVGKVHGIFHDIAKLHAGDTIKITRGDGAVVTYAVAKTEVVDAKDVDMASLLVSADTAKPGLNMITCAGDQIPGTFSLQQRVVVYAVLQ